MIYKLNDIDFTTYGLFPSRAENSNLAIAGCWDMPGRIGTTFHDWGENNGIEAYTEAGQIFFGGRMITLEMMLNASDKYAAITKVSNFYKIVNAFTGLVKLSTYWGDFSVYVNDKINITYVRNGKAKVKLSFREPVVQFSGGFIAMEDGGMFLDESGGSINTESTSSFVSTGSPTGIDGISFPALGIVPLSFTGIFTRPDPKPQQYKNYETEGYQITPRKQRDDVLTCLIVADNYPLFLSKINALYDFFSQPGAHYINYFNDVQRNFFIKDGCTVKNVNLGDRMTALMNINITETGILQPLALLTDTGEEISTDSDFSIDTGENFYQTEF